MAGRPGRRSPLESAPGTAPGRRGGVACDYGGPDRSAVVAPVRYAIRRLPARPPAHGRWDPPRGSPGSIPSGRAAHRAAPTPRARPRRPRRCVCCPAPESGSRSHPGAPGRRIPNPACRNCRLPAAGRPTGPGPPGRGVPGCGGPARLLSNVCTPSGYPHIPSLTIPPSLNGCGCQGRNCGADQHKNITTNAGCFLEDTQGGSRVETVQPAERNKNPAALASAAQNRSRCTVMEWVGPGPD